MTFLKNIQNNKRGMAMVIVLVACFVVLVTVSVGATMISNNLTTLGTSLNREKALANAQTGLERVRGLYRTDGHAFDGCTMSDCINTVSGGCGACSDLLYTSGDNQHRVRFEGLTPPYDNGSYWSRGTASLSSFGYYKQTVARRNVSLCVNYCTAAGYNCGDDGCGGSCGTCTEPMTCGGGGQPGVCGVGVAAVCGNGIIEGDEVCDSTLESPCPLNKSYFRDGFVYGSLDCEESAACNGECTDCIRIWSCMDF